MEGDVVTGADGRDLGSDVTMPQHHNITTRVLTNMYTPQLGSHKCSVDFLFYKVRHAQNQTNFRVAYSMCRGQRRGGRLAIACDVIVSLRVT